MDVPSPFPTVSPTAKAGPIDPRLQPTPDYGTLGPGSDIAGLGTGNAPAPSRGSGLRSAHLIAAVVGMVAALIVGMTKTHPIWPNSVPSRSSEPVSARDLPQIDRMKPQKQAETLLELAVGHSQGAVEQISSRVDRWNGKVQWNSQIASLTTAALNSNDMRVRESGVEVELAAYGLAKNAASLEFVLKNVDSPDHSQKIWALWALGLMANRGVESERIAGVLADHLKDDDPDSRRWAVEGLAVAGSDQAIQPLLATMHDDSSPMVRERAACSLAESGMFTSEQRMTAVPQLLNYTDDSSLDEQTREWAFQALGDITHQRLPRDSAAWRRWYESAK
ncbi:MAG: HEAT repeat domain-containing protein [Acidobacteriia bacterium]|nr:HEAT repeat domain-containing protein [Terriglobia bacterium]